MMRAIGQARHDRRKRPRLNRIPGLPDVPGIPAMPSMPGLPSLPGPAIVVPRLPLSTDMHNYRMMRGDSVAMGVIYSVTPFLAVFIVRLGGSAFDVSLLTAIPAIERVPAGDPGRPVPPGQGTDRALVQRIADGRPPVVRRRGAGRPARAGQFVVPGSSSSWAIAAIPSTVGMVAFPIVMDGAAGPARPLRDDGPPLGDHGRHDRDHRCPRSARSSTACPSRRTTRSSSSGSRIAGLCPTTTRTGSASWTRRRGRRRQRAAGSDGPARWS